jgi:starch-binding outer membrane protein, SusD/RagB family
MMYNKFSKLFAISVLSLFAFAACTDLEVAETDSVIAQTNTGTFQGDPAALLVSSYKDLGAFTDQAGIYSLYNHTSDEMIPPTRGTDWGDNGIWRSLHQHTWDGTHGFVLDSWNQLNQRSYKCNEILASNPSPEQAAQAKFMRAFYMYHVMDLFGQVPIRQVNDAAEVPPRVLTRSEAFDFIVKDLEEALPLLPQAGPTGDHAKASKAAANTLLARLFLNKGVYKAANPAGPYTFDKADMDKVIGYCDAVAADGYALERGDYFKIFSKDANSEVIFVSAEGSPQNRWFMTLHYDNNPSGWNGFATLADFYAKFNDNNDQRKGRPGAKDGTAFSGLSRGFLIGQQFNDKGEPITNSRNKKPLSFTTDVTLSGASSEKGIRVIKYHPSDAGKYILFRYADVFLMKAEAVLRGGSSTKSAKDLVNELRTARGAGALATVDNAAMLDERGRELYWEGIRRIDQVRFGTFTGTWAFKTSTDPARVLFSIPQQALDSNPNLRQNPGY